MDGELLLVDTGEIVPTDNFTPVAGRSAQLGPPGCGLQRSASPRARAWPTCTTWATARSVRHAPCRGLPLPCRQPPVCSMRGRAPVMRLGALAKIGAVISQCLVRPNCGECRASVWRGRQQRGRRRAAPGAHDHAGGQLCRSCGRARALTASQAGPDKEARGTMRALLERDVGQLRSICRSPNCRSDYSTGSFSNLRMAWQ